MKNLQHGNRNHGPDASERKQSISDRIVWEKHLLERARLPEPGFDELKKKLAESPAAAELFSKLEKAVLSNHKISSVQIQMSSAGNRGFAPDGNGGYAPYEPTDVSAEVLAEEKAIRVLDQENKEVGRLTWVRGQGEPFFCISGDESVDSLLASVEARVEKAIAEAPYLVNLSGPNSGSFLIRNEGKANWVVILDEFGTLCPPPSTWDTKRRFDLLKAQPEIEDFRKKYFEGRETKLHIEFAGKVKYGMLSEAAVILATGSGQPVAAMMWTTEGMFFHNILDEPSQKVDAILRPIEKDFRRLLEADAASS
jgi:hypothetical protein